MKLEFSFVFIILSFFLIVSCNDSDQISSIHQNEISGINSAVEAKYPQKESNIEVNSNEEFSIILDSDTFDGHKWVFSNPVNNQVIQLIKTKNEISANPLIGQNGKTIITFRAIGKGNTTVYLDYRIPGEKNTIALKKQLFNISVKDNFPGKLSLNSLLGKE